MGKVVLTTLVFIVLASSQALSTSMSGLDQMTREQVQEHLFTTESVEVAYDEITVANFTSTEENENCDIAIKATATYYKEAWIGVTCTVCFSDTSRTSDRISLEPSSTVCE